MPFPRRLVLVCAAALCLTACGGPAEPGPALPPAPVPTPLPEETLPPQAVIDAALFAVRRTMAGALPAFRRVPAAVANGNAAAQTAPPASPPTATSPAAQPVSQAAVQVAPSATPPQGTSPEQAVGPDGLGTAVQGAPATPTPWSTPTVPPGQSPGDTSAAAVPTVQSPASRTAQQEPPPASGQAHGQSNGQSNPQRRYIGRGRTQFVLPGPWTAPAEPGIVCEEAFIVTVVAATVHGGPGPDYAATATVYRDTPLPVLETRGDWLRVAMAGAAGGVGAAADHHPLDDHWIAAAAGTMGGWCIHLSGG